MRPGVLITGASGFTGYDFVPASLDAGVEVHAGVRANSKISQLQHFNLRYVIPDYIIMCLTVLSRLKETPDLTPFITSKEACKKH